MPAPAVHPTTIEVYEQIPLAYRDADEKLDWPLLRFVSLLCDQVGEVTDTLDAIDVLTPDEGGELGATSALTDPTTADRTWLAWLGQFVGLDLPPAPSVFTRHTPTVVASASGRCDTGTSVTLTLPAAPAAGDLLVACFGISQFTAARDLNLPAGWTLLDSQVNTDNRIVTISRVAATGDLGTFTFTMTGTPQVHTGVLIQTTGGNGTISAHTAANTQSTSLTAANTSDLPLAFGIQNNGSGQGNVTNTISGSGWSTDRNETPGFHAEVGGHGPATTAGGIVSPTVTWGGTVQSPMSAIVLVHSGPSTAVAEMRAAIRDRNFTRGTKASIIATARRFLIPGAFVSVTERVGDRWHYSVNVSAAQVLDLPGLTAALNAENPAGMVLTITTAGATYGDLRDSTASYSAIPTDFTNYAAIRDETV